MRTTAQCDTLVPCPVASVKFEKCLLVLENHSLGWHIRRVCCSVHMTRLAGTLGRKAGVMNTITCKTTTVVVLEECGGVSAIDGTVQVLYELE